jgi:hypothetical protein
LADSPAPKETAMRHPTPFLALSLSIALSLHAPAYAGNGTPVNSDSANVLTLAVYGDAPYGTSPGDTAEFLATPAFIDSINSDPHVAQVIHVGDIHSGKQYCTEAYDRAVLALWDAFKDPLVYTPGDNEWSDCHKPAEGGGAWNAASQQISYVLDAGGNPVDYAGGDPVANLALVRSIFYPVPGQTLGGRKKQLISQAQYFDAANHPGDGNYVENVLWVESKTLFAAINLPGGSNNDQDRWYGTPTTSARQAAEVAERTGADLRWLEQAFATAQGDPNIQAVVVIAQADMWDPEKGPAHQAGYEPFVASLAQHTLAFGKPVLLLNGDSHAYLSDNPLSAGDPLNYMHPGYDVPNFHRIVVHGSTFPLEWLRLTVDPRAAQPAGANAFGPFRWERVTQ